MSISQQFRSKSTPLKSRNIFRAKLRCRTGALFHSLARANGDDRFGSTSPARPCQRRVRSSSKSGRDRKPPSLRVGAILCHAGMRSARSGREYGVRGQAREFGAGMRRTRLFAPRRKPRLDWSGGAFCSDEEGDPVLSRAGINCRFNAVSPFETLDLQEVVEAAFTPPVLRVLCRLQFP